MYAVIRSGGKQHKVQKGERLRLEKLEGEVGAALTFSEVLLLGGDGDPRIGRPLVQGASVTARIVDQDKDKKIVVYHYRRRKGFHKKQGHRQPYTEVEITGIKA